MNESASNFELIRQTTFPWKRVLLGALVAMGVNFSIPNRVNASPIIEPMPVCENSQILVVGIGRGGLLGKASYRVEMNESFCDDEYGGGSIGWARDEEDEESDHRVIESGLHDLAVQDPQGTSEPNH